MPAAVRLPGGLDDRPRIEVALRHIPADDRGLWLRIGMAIKAGVGEDGFDLWNDWSRSSARYCDTDARGVWRSIRPDGGISLATLFFEAEKHGYVRNHSSKAGRPVAAPASRAIAAAAAEGELIPRDQHCNRATVPSYASRKQLPEAFLRSLDVTEIRYLGGPALRIPYFGREGHEIAVRIRLCLDKDGDRDRRFAWRKGGPSLTSGTLGAHLLNFGKDVNGVPPRGASLRLPYRQGRQGVQPDNPLTTGEPTNSFVYFPALLPWQHHLERSRRATTR